MLISSDDIKVQTGQTVTLPLVAEHITDLYGFQLGLRYEPAMVGIAGKATAGNLMSHDFVVVEHHNDAGGWYQYAAAQINPREPASGSGTLLSIPVRAYAPGLLNLVLDGVKLADRHGNELPVTTERAYLEAIAQSVSSLHTISTIRNVVGGVIIVGLFILLIAKIVWRDRGQEPGV